jgi:transposase-like protein
MVVAVRQGASMRAAARRFGVGLGTVQRWVDRAAEEDLDRVDWASRSSAPARQARRTPAQIEDEILTVRRTLREESVLGEYGAAAIRHELLASWSGDPARLPSLRTIGRILERRGALDARRRVRRPAPPAGWYLPDLAARRVELDSFDVIAGLRLKGGRDLEILTGISLHGGLTGAWPEWTATTTAAMLAIEAHWREHGRPAYAQFDNDTRFCWLAWLRRPVRSAGPVLPEPRRRPGLRATPGDGLPGGDRELQRTLAGKDLGTLLGRLAG